MAKSTEKKEKKHRSRVLIYTLVAVAVFSALIVGTYAKYMMGDQTEGYISSPNFYFTSDRLKETAVEYTLNPGSDGTAEISFQVRNFADNLRISDKPIEFNVVVAEGVTVKVDGKTTKTGTLAAGSTGSTAKVTVSGLQNGKTYNISVTGKAGFSTTLRAKVTVKSDEKEIYKHIDENHSHYVLLTVWTKNISGLVQISIPEGLIPDNTDSVMGNVRNFSDGAYTAITFTDAESFAEHYSSHVYRFFKTPEYQSGTFTVMLGGKEATTATPE